LAKYSDRKELEAIDSAIATLNALKQKVRYAKEKKARTETAEKRWRDVVESKLKAVVIEYFEDLSPYDQAVHLMNH